MNDKGEKIEEDEEFSLDDYFKHIRSFYREMSEHSRELSKDTKSMKIQMRINFSLMFFNAFLISGLILRDSILGRSIPLISITLFPLVISLFFLYSAYAKWNELREYSRKIVDFDRHSEKLVR